MDQHYSYLILILGLLSCFVALINADKPTITQELLDEKVKEGSTIIFICRATGATSFTWYKNSKKASNDRYEIIELDNGSLFRIYRIRKPRDEAEFKCTASNDEGSVTTSAFLTIYAETSLPSGFPVITESPGLRVIQLGLQATMDCSAEGNPNPTIHWLKDSIPIDMSDSRIRITNRQMQIVHSTKEDEGSYECYARNSAGTLFSEKAMLYIRERQNPPRFSILPVDQEIAPGQDVELTCVAIGAPMPTVHWMKDNVDINNATESRNILTLTDVRVSSNYTCRAASPLGVIYAKARVTVRAPPKAPSAPVPDLPAPAQSVTLNWTPASQEAVSSYILLYKLVSATGPYTEITGITGTTSTVENLLPFTSYEFMIKGVNTIGVGEPSPPVIVKTGELAPGSPPRRVKVSMISSSTILIQWEAPEVPNGRITGYKIYYTATPSSDLSEWETSTVVNVQLTSVSQLTPLKLYSVKVAARTEIGYGPTSPVMKIKVQRGIPSQPMNFEATSISQSEIRLTWEEPTDYQLSSRNVINYEIFYNSTIGGEQHTTISSGQGQHILSSLLPYTVYNICLAARSNTGLGPKTRIVSVRTQQAVPGAPHKVAVEALNSTAIRISWGPQREDEMNGVFHGYQIHYYQIDDNTNGRVTEASKDFMYPEQTFVCKTSNLYVITYERIG